MINVGVVLLFAGASIGLWRQQQAGTILYSENVLLREEAAQSEPLAAEHERLSRLLTQAETAPPSPNEQLAELARLRLETAARKSQLEKLRAANPGYSAIGGLGGGASEIIPFAEWKFSGYATPESTLQSMIWSMSHGDIKTFISCCAPDIARDFEKEGAFVEERDFATDAVAMFTKVENPSFQILNTVMTSGDEVHVTVYANIEDNPSIMKFKRIDGDWKFDGDQQPNSRK